ncbi:MAG: ABC transporter substrate-binding protein [Anaerolineae bacterium]|nr:ABC transporter substrate-binding protein [Anaerolineae bacterium]
MSSLRAFILSLIALMLLVPGLTLEAQPPPDGITVIDALGREVTLDHAPQRIAITGKALIMIADAIYMFPEAASRVVAVGNTGQGSLNFLPVVDPAYVDKAILDNQAGAEAIAAVQPDLVLLKSSMAETLGGPLDVLGIPVIYVDFETAEQYVRDLRTLGQLFQNEARAEELVAWFQERTERVAEALADLPEDEKPRVLLVYYTDRDGAVAFNAPPASFIQTWLVQMAGGQPVWLDAELGKGWTKVTLEQIAAWDADHVYVVAYFNPVDDVVAMLQADPQWQAMRAVRDGRLYGFPGDFYSWDQPDPRWVLGLTWLGASLHPDRFVGLDMDQEIRSFYSDLYGLDDAAYAEFVLPILKGDLPGAGE